MLPFESVPYLPFWDVNRILFETFTIRTPGRHGPVEEKMWAGVGAFGE